MATQDSKGADKQKDLMLASLAAYPATIAMIKRCREAAGAMKSAGEQWDLLTVAMKEVDKFRRVVGKPVVIKKLKDEEWDLLRDICIKFYKIRAAAGKKLDNQTAQQGDTAVKDIVIEVQGDYEETHLSSFVKDTLASFKDGADIVTRCKESSPFKNRIQEIIETKNRHIGTLQKMSNNEDCCCAMQLLPVPACTRAWSEFMS